MGRLRKGELRGDYRKLLRLTTDHVAALNLLTAVTGLNGCAVIKRLLLAHAAEVCEKTILGEVPWVGGGSPDALRLLEVRKHFLARSLAIKPKKGRRVRRGDTY